MLNNSEKDQRNIEKIRVKQREENLFSSSSSSSSSEDVIRSNKGNQALARGSVATNASVAEIQISAMTATLSGTSENITGLLNASEKHQRKIEKIRVKQREENLLPGPGTQFPQVQETDEGNLK